MLMRLLFKVVIRSKANAVWFCMLQMAITLLECLQAT